MDYSQLWLRYRRAEDTLPSEIYYNSDDKITLTAVSELTYAMREICNITAEAILHNHASTAAEGIYLINRKRHGDYYDKNIQAYRIESKDGKIIISSDGSNGILNGVFAFIRLLRLGHDPNTLNIEKSPDNPLRMLDHWDNADGSIERGYAGNSFFFENDRLIINERTRDYARLISSIGINAVVINNVNVNGEAIRLITDKYFDELHKLMDIFSAYGIRLFLCADYAAPVSLGELDTADPFDEAVIRWWNEKVNEIYNKLPLLGGLVIKADSEGRPGPFTYGRNQADGANLLANALQPHGGILIWRCFVYNCRQDWRDRKTDRARACYDYFNELDGEFYRNVILQIKNGPMDFQVMEPVSPLLGAMPLTNKMMEVQITQEYTGQQKDLCYLIPRFKEILDFKMYRNEEYDTVADYINGNTYGNRLCGIAAVANTGNDYNWTGHDLAAANLYGFGRIAFDISLSAEEIAHEWIRLTYGDNMHILSAVSEMLMGSWETYRKYTAPLGVGWMVAPHYHYSPDIDGYEYSRWGTYHYADRNGIGVDRTSSGTGYVKQYNKPVQEYYENLSTCPDELLLFFHHLPYTYVLHSGETIIQHIYNTHFEGVIETKHLIELWKSVKPYMEPEAFQRVINRLELQLKNAIEWRDIINTYFYRKSGIADKYGRLIYE